MEHDRRVELIDLAIQKVIQDNINNNNTTTTHSHDDAQHQLALSHLLSASQLGLLKKDEEVLELSKASTPSDMVASVVHKIESENMDGGEVDGKCSKSEADEVVKELKKVSLLLKVKDGIQHPFRSFTSMLKGMVKVPDMNGQDGDNKEQQSESPSLPSLIPEMPQMDVPNLGLHNEKE